jgi:hypothetical protein
MSNRAATILAIAAVLASLCLYATFAQEPPRVPEVEDGAFVVGPAPIRLEQELPGRYQVTATSTSGGLVTVIVLDTHTGHLWSKTEGLSSWKDWNSPVKER